MDLAVLAKNLRALQTVRGAAVQDLWPRFNVIHALIACCEFVVVVDLLLLHASALVASFSSRLSHSFIPSLKRPIPSELGS